MDDVTRILPAIVGGDEQATGQLLTLVYDELRKLATQKLAQEKPGQTLQATVLVHEAYLRLVGAGDPGWSSRGHFFAAVEAMRHIVIEAARRKRTEKHGGQSPRHDLDEAGALDQRPTRPPSRAGLTIPQTACPRGVVNEIDWASASRPLFGRNFGDARSMSLTKRELSWSRRPGPIGGISGRDGAGRDPAHRSWVGVREIRTP
jgi:hypothetical protein